MSSLESTDTKTGEDVERAVGELTATTEAAKTAFTEIHVEHEEVKSWLKLILEAIVEVFKK